MTIMQSYLESKLSSLEADLQRLSEQEQTILREIKDAENRLNDTRVAAFRLQGARNITDEILEHYKNAPEPVEDITPRKKAK